MVLKTIQWGIAFTERLPILFYTVPNNTRNPEFLFFFSLYVKANNMQSNDEMGPTITKLKKGKL